MKEDKETQGTRGVETAVAPTKWWRKLKPWAWLAAVMVTTVACYVEIPRAEFVYDDDPMIVSNPTLRTMSPLSKFFTDPHAYSAMGYFTIYRAIPALSYAADYQIGYLLDRLEHRANPESKPDATVFHTTNILLHEANAVLVFALLMMMFRNALAAAIGALIFAVHPVNIESVSWVSRRGNEFFLLFALVGLMLHMRLRSGAVRKGLLYTGELACYALSLLSQELGVMLPGLLVAYDVLLAPGERRKVWEWVKYYAPFVVIGVLYLVLRHAVLGRTAQQGYYGDSFYVTMLTMSKVFVTYLRQMFAPVGLSVMYVVPLSRSLGEWQVAVSIAVLAGLVVSAAALCRRVPLYAFCVAWFFITLSPASNVVPLQSLRNDRFLYMTTVGLGIGFAGLLAWSMKEKKDGLSVAVAVVLGVAVAAGAATTYFHNKVWQNGLSLWSSAVIEQPEEYTVVLNLGVSYQDRAEQEVARGQQQAARWDAERAIAQWKDALKLQEKPFMAAKNLAGGYAWLGRLDEAEDMARQALAWAPELYPTRYLMGSVLEKRGRVGEAETWYRRATEGEVRVEWERYPAYQSLARLILNRAHSGEEAAQALAYAEKAYSLRGDAGVALTLAEAYIANGRTEDAKKLARLWYQQLEPDDKHRAGFERLLGKMGIERP